MQSNRVVSLDVLRLLCAFGIVCLHFSSPSGWIEYFSRIAVPVFFIISGYFTPFGDLRKVFKSIQKITKLKGKDVFMPIRIAMTGNQHGLELAAVIPLLGVERVAARVKASMAKVGVNL